MRLSLTITLELGKSDLEVEQLHDADHVGTHHQAEPVGFTQEDA